MAVHPLDQVEESVLEDVGGIDPTMQPGTGAGDFISSLQWSMTAGKAQVSLSGSYQVNTTNDFNYRFGNEALGAVTVSRAYGRFSPSFQVKLWNRPRSVFVDDSRRSTTPWSSAPSRPRHRREGRRQDTSRPCADRFRLPALPR